MSVSFPFHSLFLASWQNRLMHCYSSSPKRLLISHLNIYSFQNSISGHNIKHKYCLKADILLWYRFPSFDVHSTHPRHPEKCESYSIKSSVRLCPPYRKNLQTIMTKIDPSFYHYVMSFFALSNFLCSEAYFIWY